VPQHRDHVVGRDDAREAAVLIHHGERDQVVFVEERATSSCGVSRAQAM